MVKPGAQWLSGRVLDSRPKGHGFEPHRCHCVVSLSKNINPSLVLVQPRKIHPFITERLLMGRKESNQTTNKWFIDISMCFFHALIFARSQGSCLNTSPLLSSVFKHLMRDLASINAIGYSCMFYRISTKLALKTLLKH